MAAEERDPNRDPLSDESGSHPVGTGVGAAGGAVAGVAAGTAAGPLGMAVGGVVGAVVGGLAGKAAAEALNPSEEEAHWRDRFTQEPYYQQGRSFEDYGPAYRYGAESRASIEDDWDTAATRLESGWSGARGSSTLDWDQARPASRAAWDRADTMRTGSAGGTGTSGSTGTMGAAASTGTTGTGGAAATVGEAQQAGDDSGSREDVLDVLEDLVECCKDGEYGFRECADHAKREELRATFRERAEDCQRGARELQDCIRQLGGQADDSGSALGAVHRGWVSVRAILTTHDDEAMLTEAERGEDNALARYRKALQKPLPSEVREVVERQLQGVQRNHDEIKRLRDRMRSAG
ncbi:ferritin-like domain-containing protein [Ramlibacter sp. MAHUQ-53]|uniref:ferritin-like domain-containing protein n=1 Tax=unclassified Ramlibacter TaxID=2617605 RepID=UPI003625B807